MGQAAEEQAAETQSGVETSQSSASRSAPAFLARQIPAWKRYLYQVIASRISIFTKYYDALVQFCPGQDDPLLLYEQTECPKKRIAVSTEELGLLRSSSHDHRAVVLLNGNLNYDNDIEATLGTLKTHLTRLSRVVIVAYNPYLRWLYYLANILKLRSSPLPTTFLTNTDLSNLAKLSGYEVVKITPVGYCPIALGGFGDFINRVLPAIPGLRWIGLCAIIVLRPVLSSSRKPSISIVIPCRNEKGNIEAALQRMPNFGAPTEILFIEGHSKDGTWEEVQRVCAKYADKFKLQAFQQTGKGKSDAVRLGFSKATNEIVTILDADLTMPPELLTRFYDAYCNGHADFVNGSRLVYPMEGEAMRFLNRLGNTFFAKALSFVLSTRLGDSLCGTKLLLRSDYQRMIEWRKDFGDFDPFGDFELLFPAAILGLGTIDIPIAYRARTYGSTNIRRFYHGLMLLRMTLLGFAKVRIEPSVL